MIVAIIDIVLGGIAVIVLGAVSPAQGYNLTYYVITGIGAIICGALMLMYGMKIRNGEISAKIDILAQFVRIIGVVTIIGGIFSAAASIALNGDLGSAVIAAIINIIVGLIIIFIASKINDGKQTTGDKIIWIILLIAFVLCLLGAILEIISIVLIINGICDLIIYVFMLMLLFDPEVKSEMNM